MKKILIIVAVIILIIAIVFFATRNKTANSTYQVTYETVSKGDVNLSVSGTGSVVSKTNQNVMGKVSTKVVEVDVKLGDKVSKGDVIAKLDNYDLLQAEKSAEYNFNSAYYRREQLKAATLKDDNAINQAQQQLNVTSVTLESAKNSLNNATITSPITGTITTLNVKLGDYASLTTPLAVVQDLSNLEALLNVNEIDVNKVKVGQDVNLAVDAINGSKKGKVTSVENTGVNINGVINYTVHSDFENIDGLKPAMTINADIAVENKMGVLRVPAVSVKTVDSVSTVQIVKAGVDLTKITNSDLETKEIKTGLDNNSYIEVLSGLSEGDLVVTSVTKNSTNLFGLGGTSSN